MPPTLKFPYIDARSQMSNAPIVRHISECFIRPKYNVDDTKNSVYVGPGDLVMLSAPYIQKGLLFSKPLPTRDERDLVKNFLDNFKHSLSLVLVHFYPLVGQLETEIDEDQHTSLVLIKCNKGPRAKFIHATLDMSISEILSPDDVPRVVQSFFDHDRAVNHDGHIRPLLSIQVTELIDGVFIGCSMNHVCGDETSYWHFFNMWSEIFMENGENIVISRPPIHERWFMEGTGPIIKLPFIHPDEFVSRFEAPEWRKRIFHFSSEPITKLKTKVSGESGPYKNISSFQSLVAFVWRCITRIRDLHDDVETRCILAIDNRVRLNPRLSSNCFGALIQSVEGRSKVGKLLSQNLGFAASLLHQVVVEHTDEKVRNAVKGWMQSPFVYRSGSYFDPSSLMITSSPRFDVYGNEFGFGKALAVLSGYARKCDGKITSYPGREGGGSIDLEICLSPDTMRLLESDKEFMEIVYVV